MALTTSDYQLQQKAYAQANPAINVPVQPTIASAVGQIDSLNDRLMSIKQHLTGISDAIGGPRPVSGSAGEKPIPGGVVHRLNIGANDAHGHITDIEELIGAISRSLG